MRLLDRAAARFAEKGRRLDMDQVSVGDYGHRLCIALPDGMGCMYDSGWTLPDGSYEKNPSSIEDFVDRVLEKYPEGFTP